MDSEKIIMSSLYGALGDSFQLKEFNINEGKAVLSGLKDDKFECVLRGLPVKDIHTVQINDSLFNTIDIDFNCSKLVVDSSSGYSMHIKNPVELSMDNSHIRFIMIGLNRESKNHVTIKGLTDKELTVVSQDTIIHDCRYDSVNIDVDGKHTIIRNSDIGELVITNVGNTGEIYISNSKINSIRLKK